MDILPIVLLLHFLRMEELNHDIIIVFFHDRLSIFSCQWSVLTVHYNLQYRNWTCPSGVL
jgi:hypothetical protein